MRMAERAMSKRAARRLSAETGPKQTNEDVDTRAIREARSAAKQRIATSPSTYAVLRALSFAMKLDLWLFGHVTSGPFFALMIKEKAHR